MVKFRDTRDTLRNMSYDNLKSAIINFYEKFDGEIPDSKVRNKIIEMLQKDDDVLDNFFEWENKRFNVKT